MFQLGAGGGGGERERKRKMERKRERGTETVFGVVVVRWDACMGKSRGSRRAGRHLRFDQAGPPEWLPLNALFKTTLTFATMISGPDVASNVGWGLRLKV